MKRLQSVVTATLLAVFVLFSAQTCVGQSKKVPDQPQGVTFGVKIKGGYMPSFWRITQFTNIPENLRTVNYSDGSSYTFDQTQMKVHTGWLVPVNVGPSVSFENFLELSGGGSVAYNGNTSNNMQLGCYCVGSTVTYIEMRETPVMIGGFGDLSLRLKKKIWFTAEASSYPVWGNIRLRQGFSAYGGDQTILAENIGNYRVPLMLLGGLKFCGECDGEWRGSFGFRAGVAFWQNHINQNIVGMGYPAFQQMLMIESFLDADSFFHKKKKGI